MMQRVEIHSFRGLEVEAPDASKHVRLLVRRSPVRLFALIAAPLFPWHVASRHRLLARVTAPAVCSGFEPRPPAGGAHLSGASAVLVAVPREMLHASALPTVQGGCISLRARTRRLLSACHAEPRHGGSLPLGGSRPRRRVFQADAVLNTPASDLAEAEEAVLPKERQVSLG